MDSPVLLFQNPSSIPIGTQIFSDGGLWVIHDDLQTATFYGSKAPISYSINDLNLKDGDEVKQVNYIVGRSVIFFFAIRSKIPTGFLVDTKNSDDSFMPRTLSFSLNCLNFHCNIISAYSPIEGCFCVISKEGISLHDTHLRKLFDLQMKIQKCCMFNNFLELSSKKEMIIYKFDNEQYYRPICKYQTSSFGFPEKMIILSTCILLVYSDGNNMPQIQKITIEDRSGQQFICEPHIYSLINFGFDTNLTNIKFLLYDDILLVYDTLKKRCMLFDFSYGKGFKKIGDMFKLEYNLLDIFSDDFALCDNAIYDIKTNYESLTQTSKYLIASLFKRKNGLMIVTQLLIKRLNEKRDLKKVLEVVRVVSSVIITPIAQIRFIMALKFGIIYDPHVLILSILEFSKIIGDKMIQEVKETIFELFSNKYCINTL